MGATALLAGGGYWLIQGKDGSKFPVPSYQVLRVVDGDTFETTNRQLIRLTGIDAPEIDNCGGKEAKEELEKLVMGKNIYLKVIFRDKSNRLISHVYNEKGLVAQQLVEKGSVFYTGDGIDSDELKNLANIKKENKVGIFGDCVETENKKNPTCNIKGNYRKETGEKLYRFPGCGQYHSTLVQTYLGDRWFCSEEEAVEAGYHKGSDCFDRKAK